MAPQITRQFQGPLPAPIGPTIGLDPISEYLIEAIGLEILRRILRQKGETLAQPGDEPVREGAPGQVADLNINLAPAGCWEEMCEERLFDTWMEDGCGCHQRRKASGCKHDCDEPFDGE